MIPDLHSFCLMEKFRSFLVKLFIRKTGFHEESIKQEISKTWYSYLLGRRKNLHDCLKIKEICIYRYEGKSKQKTSFCFWINNCKWLLEWFIFNRFVYWISSQSSSSQFCSIKRNISLSFELIDIWYSWLNKKAL